MSRIDNRLESDQTIPTFHVIVVEKRSDLVSGIK
jgi:hypothetical protein